MWIISSCIFAFICGIVANNKGRNVIGWVIGGFLTGLIGLIILLFLSNLKEERNYRNAMDMKNRRLAEQLRQEQLKAEALRHHVTARLDSHDNALGMDTRQNAFLPGGNGTALNELSNSLTGHNNLPSSGGESYLIAADAPQQMVANTAVSTAANQPPPYPVNVAKPQVQWYYEMNGQSLGPIGEREILAMLQQGILKRNNLLWSERLAEWTPAHQIPEFA